MVLEGLNIRSLYLSWRHVYFSVPFYAVF